MTAEDPRQCWATPQAFIQFVTGQFGPLHLDACATRQNAKAPRYIAPVPATPTHNSDPNCVGYDGLVHPWRVHQDRHTRVWCNPGFANVEPWLAKAYEEANGGTVETLVLTHASHSAAWFAKYIRCAHRVYAVRPRINFIMPDGIKASSNPRDSFLWHFKPYPQSSAAIYVMRPWKGGE